MGEIILGEEEDGADVVSGDEVSFQVFVHSEMLSL